VEKHWGLYNSVLKFPSVTSAHMENFKEQQDMEQKERTSWTTPATDISVSSSLWRLTKKPVFPGY